MNNLKFMDQVVFTSDRGTKLVGYCEQTDSYTIVDVTVSGSVGVVPHIETTKKDEKRVLGCGFLLAYVGETRGGMIEEEIKTAEAVTKSIKEGHAAVPDTLFFQRTDDGNMGVCLTISSEGHPHITETVVTILEEKKLSQ